MFFAMVVCPDAGAAEPILVTGWNHSFAVNDGQLFAWGQGAQGQIGDGSVAMVFAPRALATPGGVIAVAAGAGHSLAVSADGQLWSWGDNALGQLGSGSTLSRSNPAAVPSIAPLRRVGAGLRNSLAIRDDGVVLAWGYNGYGAVGDGTNANRTSPVAIALSDAVAVDGGDDYCVALTADGGVWTWGENSYGRLGLGGGGTRMVPTRTAVTAMMRVDAGPTHVVALKSDGSVWTWGQNNAGQLGTGEPAASRSAPAQVGDLSGVVAIAAGDGTGYAVRGDGTLWAWGLNSAGQLGDGTLINRTRPIQVPGIATAIAVAAGRHALVRLVDGSVLAMGINANAELGDHSRTNRSTPVVVGNSGFTLASQAAIPATQPLGGDHRVVPTTITWSSATADATIRVTSDLGIPVAASPAAPAGTLSLAMGSTVIRARAFASGAAPSRIASARFQVGGAISASWNHTLSVTSSGDLVAWGSNQLGQVGIGSTSNVLHPQWLAAPGRVISVATGGTHSLAVDGDGGLWTWGQGNQGQLGTGAVSARATPTLVPGVASLRRVGAGQYHSLAIAGDGAVLAWGYNVYGQLGDGTATQRTSPVAVALADAIAVDGGIYHSIALDRHGVAWAWGYNGYGQLGLGDTNSRSTPMRVGISDVVQVDSGENFVVALRADGSVWTWGSNQEKQLGTGEAAGARSVPAPVDDLGQVISIAAGLASGYAVRVDGTLWAWGNNPTGQLGDGTTTQRPRPVQVPGIAGAVAVAAGAHVVVLLGDGSLVTFGTGTGGELGDGTFVNRSTPAALVDPNLAPQAARPVLAPLAGHYRATPTAVGATIATSSATIRTTTDRQPPTPSSPALTGTLSLGAGATVVRARGFAPGLAPGRVASARYLVGGSLSSSWYHTLALTTGGEVVAWGYNGNGQIGNGDTVNAVFPQRLAAPIGIQAIAAGGHHSLLVDAAGAVWGMGDGSRGQLGGGTTSRALPTVVVGLPTTRRVGAGRFHSFAIAADGSLMSWGLNSQGQLGDGSLVQRTAPVPVSLGGVLMVDGGDAHSVALDRDGAVWSWGYNGYGQLGTGNNTQVTLPVRIGLSDMVQVDAGEHFTIALRADGTVWTWGYNGYGQLGNGTTTTRDHPARISTLTDIISVAAGVVTSYAVRADGTLWAWGSNDSGQIGDGTTIQRPSPVQVPGIATAVAVAAGTHAAVQLADGSMMTFGANGSGQVGDGTLANRSSPQPIAALTVAAQAAKPVLQPPGGHHRIAPAVAMSSVSAGATIRSTLDRQVPGPASPIASAPQTMATGVGILRARAFSAGLAPSETSSARYHVGGTVATSWHHSFALSADGFLTAWGYNNSGQIGDGSTMLALEPTRLAAPVDVVSVATSRTHSLAATRDGALWSWGEGTYGRLGNGATTGRATPAAVTGITGIIRVGAGLHHSFAITADGGVLAWGYNGNYQIGDGTTTQRTTPVAIGLTNVIAIDGGENSSVALDRDGNLWTWGYNGQGQLGTGEGTSRTLPTRIGLTDVLQVDSGANHMIALRADGTVWSWGYSQFGQLGTGEVGSSRFQPARIAELVDITSIAAGADGGYAVRADGTLWAWGYNGNGQLGDGTTVNKPRPIQVLGIANAIAVAAGAHAIVQLADGTLVGFGTNTNAELGDGSLVNRTLPQPLVELTLGSQAVRPRMSPPGGHRRANPTAVTIASTSAGAVIRSTLDLSAPTTASPLGASRSLGNGVAILRARAFSTGLATSATASARYQIGATLAASWHHTFALAADGSLHAWGYNHAGQIGDGSTASVLEPRAIPAPANVESIAVGAFHSLAADADGQLWTWGEGTSGKLGHGANTSRAIPTIVPGVASIRRVGAGLQHSLAITSTGQVLAWGQNNSSQLGDGTTTTRSAPVAIGLQDAIAVDGGADYSVALDGEGSAWTWGTNSYGQLGTGDRTIRALPTRLALSQIVQIEAGAAYTVALRGDGTVWTWGYSQYGQLGHGETGNVRDLPTRVMTLQSIVSIAAGANTGYAVRADGTLWAWGYNGEGQLGDGTTTNRSTPIQVPGITSAVSVAAGVHAVVMLADGALVAFGGNSNGELGDGTTTHRSLPAPIGNGFGTAPAVAPVAFAPPAGHFRTLSAAIGASPTPGATIRYTTDRTIPSAASPSAAAGSMSLTNGVTILRARGFSGGLAPGAVASARYQVGPILSSAWHHTIALETSGRIATWGYNNAGQLGNGSTGTQTEPSLLEAPTDVVAIATSAYHSLAVTGDGRLWSWGEGTYGKLGDGATTNRSRPNATGVTGLRRVGAGLHHSLAVRDDGRVLAWGLNNNSQVGDGTTTNRLLPVELPIASAIAVDAGENFSLALDRDGSIWTWGYGGYGQLGAGTSTYSQPVPARIGLANMVQAECGVAFSVALKADGTVWSWGYNQYGQLGVGDATQRMAPVAVAGLSSVVSIAAGANTAYAVLADGSLWAWGYNGEGQVGDGTTVNRNRPQLVAGIANAVSVAAGVHAAVLLADGTVVAFGGNGNGELGDGTLTHRSSPVPVGSGFTLAPQVAKPVATPQGGHHRAIPLTVATTTTTPGAVIRYTDDRQLPSPGSTLAVGGHVPVAAGVAVIRARGFADGLAPSAPFNARYQTGPLLVTAWHHTLALSASGNLATWGYNNDGQLGNGFTIGQLEPRALAAPVDVVAIAASAYHSLAVDGSGQLWSWGDGLYGKLGDGTVADRALPAVVPGVAGMRRVGAGLHHSLGIRNDGSVLAWGYNANGQLGDGTTTQRTAPVAVALGNAISVDGGESFSVALDGDGFAWTWGYGGLGQLGVGTSTTQSPSPIRVGLAQVVQVEAGVAFVVALKADGTVWTWGYNQYGQLGIGENNGYRYLPVAIAGLTSVVSIAAGANSAYAVRADGTVWAWGYNQGGQLGDTTTTDRNRPVQVAGIAEAVAVSAGVQALVLLRDGTVVAFGGNSNGEVGDGTTTNRTSPVILTSGLFTRPRDLRSDPFGPRRAILTWRGNMAAQQHEVQRRESGLVWTTIASVGSARYADNGVRGGVSYEWRVRETAQGSQSPWSDVASATMPADSGGGSSELSATAGDDLITEGAWPVPLDASRSLVARGQSVGYRVAGPHARGSETVLINGGTGDVLIGDSVRFGGSNAEYQVQGTHRRDDGQVALLLVITSNPGSLEVLPANSPLITVYGSAHGHRVLDAVGHGDRSIRVGGGTGIYQIDDIVRLEPGSMGNEYRVIGVTPAQANALVLDLQPIGLIANLSDRAQVAVTTEIVAWNWEWRPDGSTWMRLGEGRQYTRALRGTDSDPWAYAGTAFRDAWGRPTGAYDIRLTVVDSSGRSASDLVRVDVIDGAPPVADAGALTRGGVNGPPVFFDASSSSDDYGIVDAWWDVNTAVNSDGVGGTDDDRDAVGVHAAFTYGIAGSYTAKLVVRDGRGQVASDIVPVEVVANHPPQVSTVSWQGDGRIPHPIVSGVATRLKARVRDAGAITYRWTFPDGSQQPATGSPPATAADPWAIEIQKTFTGAVGTTLSATLTAWDAAGEMGVATYRMRIAEDTPRTRADLAIDEGLWFLHKSQNHTATVARGSWPTNETSATASSLQAFGIHGNRPYGDRRSNPYIETVHNGIGWLCGSITPTASYQTTFDNLSYTSGAQMTDGNRRALDVEYPSPYQLGQVMDAFAATESPLAIAERGPAAVVGRRYLDLMRDMIDTYAWGQAPNGGWRYSWNSDADNSACQWAAIGFKAAEEVFGLYPPDWVKTHNLPWLKVSYAANPGGFGYASPGAGPATTPSGLVQMAWQGVPAWDRRWSQCESVMRASYWNGVGEYKGLGNFNLYAVYAATKALRLANPRPVKLLDGFFDWYEDPSDGLRARLIQYQDPDGKWRTGFWSLGESLSTAWCVIILSPNLFVQPKSHIGNHPPIAKARSIIVPTDPGSATATVSVAQINDGSSDPDGDAISFRLIPSGPYPVGVNQVAFVVSDRLGLASSVAVTVTVEDREPPRIAAMPPLVVATDPGRAVASVGRLGVPAATDNVGVVELIGDALAPLAIGTHTVRWTARDAAGNTATAQRAIRVEDREPPRIVAPGSLVMALPDGHDTVPRPDLGVPSTQDNVAVASVGNDAPGAFPLGRTTVTWTATDAAGNRATATQIVVVKRAGHAPQVTLTSPGDGIVFLAGSTLNITAVVEDVPAGDVLKVDFYGDGALLVADAEAPYAATWSDVAAGPRVIVARAHLRAVAGSSNPAIVASPAHTVTVVVEAEVQP